MEGQESKGIIGGHEFHSAGSWQYIIVCLP